MHFDPQVLILLGIIIFIMSLEEEDRLNFYSKYNRVRQRQYINSLYALIGDHNASNSNIQIQIVHPTTNRDEHFRNSSLSPRSKNRKSSKQIIPVQWHGKGSEQETKQNIEQINDKMQKLKKLQQEFHKQMQRRERQIRKKKELKEQQIKQRQKYKDNLINVVDSKPQKTPSRKSSAPQSKKNSAKEPQIFLEPQLDFQDYYRDVPQVPICAAYEITTKTNREIRQKLLNQRNRQQFVQSVDQDADRKTNSIVIDRINVSNRGQIKGNQQRGENKNLYEVQLTHSRSEHIFPQFRCDKVNQQILEPHDVRDILISNKEKDQQQNVQQYSPAKQLQSLQNNINLASLDNHKNDNDQFWIPAQDSYQHQALHDQLRDQHFEQEPLSQKQHQQSKDFLGEQSSQNEINNFSEYDNMPIRNNKTGTEQGEQMKDQIQDRVEPIVSRSQFSPQQGYLSGGPSVFLSQAIPKSKLHLSPEVELMAAESLDSQPLQPTEAAAHQNKSQNKKSSFKRLIAENRSNLIPRMAISTILNQHINEALIDFKTTRAHPVHAPLHQSIISSETPTSSCKKRVNFKQRLVEQQLDKSHSRQGRPSFHRDQAKAEKNRSLLLNFFAEN